jgi:ABC-type nitrate/sulfonate/bicarbonate transport system ATPase subunit
MARSRDRARDLLALVGLNEKYPRLSGGMQQPPAIARAHPIPNSS